MSPHLFCVGGEDHNLRIPFLAGLREMGFGVTAVGGDPAQFVRAGLEFRPWRFDRFLSPVADRAAIRTLSRLIADDQPDLVHSFDTKPNLITPLAALRAGDVPVIRTINGMGWVFSSRSPLALALRPVYRALQRRAGRLAAATVFQNSDDRVYFERHGLVAPDRSQLVPGSGIDVDAFERQRAMAPAGQDLRAALGLGTTRVIVTVARLTRQKGIRTLLEAARIVNRQRPDTLFLLVGPRESEGFAAISQAEIDRHRPYVRALGRRDDVPALLGLAELFALPTEYREGVPRALMEAALAGLPIVTTLMPGCTDVVSDGGNGFLVPPRNPRLLADRILSLLADPTTARAMGARGADLARRKFSLATTLAAYAALYDLARRNRSPAR